MAKVVGVTPAGYDAWKNRASHRGEPALVRRRLDEAAAWEHEVSSGTYGAPRIRHALTRAGRGCQSVCVRGLIYKYAANLSG